MSVINRMLTDLEHRGAPGARQQRAADGPTRAETPSRALPWLRRLGPLVLLAALVIVGGALWLEQWPRVLALVENTRGPSVAEETVTEDQASSEQPLPGVRRFEFQRDGTTTRLVVAFDRPLEAAPGYARSGDRIALRLPARWDREELPALPEEQSVYRSAVVDERGDEGTRIGMRVDPDARFDLAIDGDRLTLSGRAPSATEGGDAGDRSATDGPDTGGGAGTDTVADASEPGADRSGDSGGAGATTAGHSDATVEAEQGHVETGDRDARAAEGQDSASVDADVNGADGGSRTRTAAADDGGESGQPEARSNESEGRVRKSEPDITPQERARRLEARAREALGDGDVTAARTHLATALEFDADRHSARDLLVGLALRSGDAATARNLLAEGVARAPERGAYAKPFARLLVDAGDLERALRVLRRAAPAADRDAGYHGLTAAVAQRLNRHELAASEYTRALEIDSSRGVWWMGLGISLRATDHPDEALAAFREARASGDLNERLDSWVRQRIEALSRTGE